MPEERMVAQFRADQWGVNIVENERALLVGPSVLCLWWAPLVMWWRGIFVARPTSVVGDSHWDDLGC